MACDTASYTDYTVVIVLNIRGRVIGAAVESVSDVLTLGAESIKPAPKMDYAAGAGCIMGMGWAKSDDFERPFILTDIEALRSSAEMGLMEAAMH